jgi:8-oxo-dGTP pyrophosphatase MutT (NUDIX family)
MEKKSWETLSTEVLAENKFSSYHHDKFKTPDGVEGDFYYLKTPVGEVVIIPVLDDGRIVLHHEYKYIFDRISLEFASGGIKLGQTIEEAAKAELREETGCTASSLELVHRVARDNGIFKQYTNIFFATKVTQGESTPDNTEEFEMVYLTVSELDKVMASGEIWDVSTISAWHLVRPRVIEYINSIKQGK